MKPTTAKTKQWLWFIALWCGGLAAMALLANLFRYIIFDAH
ncbi:MAG: hypothetical protein PVI54_19525 [Desulfobacteraceae bacterium]|jgi:hypothetical protein